MLHDAHGFWIADAGNPPSSRRWRASTPRTS